MDLTEPYFIFTPSELLGLKENCPVFYSKVSEGVYRIEVRLSSETGTRGYSKDWTDFESADSEPELRGNVRAAFANILEDHLRKRSQGC